jgi:hypothetical protein
MNIWEFPTPRLLEFHMKVRECLAKDDANPNSIKHFGVRSDPDWRQVSDAVEAELQQRGVPVRCIDWKESTEPHRELELGLDPTPPLTTDHETLLWRFFTQYYHDWALRDSILHETEAEEAIIVSARTMRVLENVFGAERLRLCLARWAADGDIKVLGPHKLLRPDEPCVQILGYVD